MSDQAVSCYTASMVEMPDIARLTPEERLELIGRLWDSLEFRGCALDAKPGCGAWPSDGDL